MTSPHRVQTRVYDTGRHNPEHKWAHDIDINGRRISFAMHPDSRAADAALKLSLEHLQRDIAKALLSL